MVIVQHQEIQFPATWEEAEALVRCFTDVLGRPVDEGILPTVVAFNLLGLYTCQSCEGHLDNGLPYPWVDFETDEFPTFAQALEEACREGLSSEEQEAKGAQLVEIAASLPSCSVLAARLEELLDLYYRDYSVIPEERRLVVHLGSPILFRLMPYCGYEADSWDEETRVAQLSCAQAEMQAFTSFLKQHWQCEQAGF